MADRRIRVEQDGRDFYVRDVGAPCTNPTTMGVLKCELVLIHGTEEECTVTIPRLGLWGDSTENGNAWRAWFVAYCEARGYAVVFPDPFKTGMVGDVPEHDGGTSG